MLTSGELAMQNATAELKGDREFVLAAVAQNGNALRCAAAELYGCARPHLAISIAIERRYPSQPPLCDGWPQALRVNRPGIQLYFAV
jgi:hypothetical protein